MRHYNYLFSLSVLLGLNSAMAESNSLKPGLWQETSFLHGKKTVTENCVDDPEHLIKTAETIKNTLCPDSEFKKSVSGQTIQLKTKCRSQHGKTRLTVKIVHLSNDAAEVDYLIEAGALYQKEIHSTAKYERLGDC